MERLIRNRLLYGRLFLVDQPHLVERYNLALIAFGHDPTNLQGFGIDATGYSPEIATELGDDLYLNPFGVNQRFIILSPDQARMPVIQSNFTSTAELMHAFMRDNAEQLRVLTLKDVVYGEIEDSTLRISSIDDLLAMRNVEFKVRTTSHLVDKAARLKEMAARFEIEADAWRDEEMISEMLDLARHCGDVRRNDMVPRKTHYEHPSYWTSHYGGLYVFRDGGETTVLGNDPVPAFREDARDVPDWYIPLSDERTVFTFLENTGRLEAFNPAWLTGSGVLTRRMDHYVRFQISQSDPDRKVGTLDTIDLKNWVNSNMHLLDTQPELDFLYTAQRLATGDRSSYPSSVPHRARFLAHRAVPDHADRNLVNRLIAEYIPFDFLTRFVVNKDAFYRDYRHYPEPFRDFVVETMRSTYLPDKRAFRARLFEDWGLTTDA